MDSPTGQQDRRAESRPGGVPPASTLGVRRRMQATRRRDTAPELALRRELYHRGLRYRVDLALPELPRRRMDIVFTRARLVVLVDGCFWHGCPEHGTTARANAAFWAAKITANKARDVDTDRRLEMAGWTVLRVWEHEPAEAAADRIVETFQRLRSRPLTGI
jgi:DNA mismatch endonuclease (patch repair protein)